MMEIADNIKKFMLDSSVPSIHGLFHCSDLVHE